VHLAGGGLVLGYLGLFLTVGWGRGVWGGGWWGFGYWMAIVDGLEV